VLARRAAQRVAYAAVEVRDEAVVGEQPWAIGERGIGFLIERHTR
jgi:hypothetical protein